MSGTAALRPTVAGLLAVTSLALAYGVPQMTSEGAEFLLAFPANNVTWEAPQLHLAVADTAGEITRAFLHVEFNGSREDARLEQVLVHQLPPGQVVREESQDTAPTVLVTSDFNISLAARYSASSLLALPVASLGRSYRAVTPAPGSSSSSSSSSVVVVTAVEDNTSVCLHFSPPRPHLLQHAGQSLLLSEPMDLSGLAVTSDKPINVISGTHLLLGNAEVATVAMTMPPEASWGEMYWTLPSPALPWSSLETYLVVAGQPLTSVVTSDGQYILLEQAGTWWRQSWAADSLQSLSCSKPCLALKLSSAGLAPCNTPLVPVQQWLTSYTFPSLHNDTTVLVLVPIQDAAPQVSLNGTGRSLAWTLQKQTGDVRALTCLVPPHSAVSLVSSGQPFAAFLIEPACRPAGMGLDPINSATATPICSDVITPASPSSSLAVDPASTDLLVSPTPSVSQESGPSYPPAPFSSSTRTPSSSSTLTPSGSADTDPWASLHPTPVLTSPSTSPSGPPTLPPASATQGGQPSSDTVTSPSATVDVTASQTSPQAGVTSAPTLLERCFCRRLRQCQLTRNASLYGSLVMAEVLVKVDRAVNDLKVDKSKLSASRRRLGSAADHRPSAQGLGSVVGIGLIAAVLALLVLPDIASLAALAAGLWSRRAAAAPGGQQEPELPGQEGEARETTEDAHDAGEASPGQTGETTGRDKGSEEAGLPDGGEAPADVMDQGEELPADGDVTMVTIGPASPVPQESA